MEGTNAAQAAMEYLMTYGWAILIIAVVIGALAYLGVFNLDFIVPKTQPGYCQVFRPNGPDTATNLALQGLCNTYPEYTLSIKTDADYILGNDRYLPTGSSPRTITEWVYYQGGSFAMLGGYGSCISVKGSLSFIMVSSGSLWFWGWGDDFYPSLSVPENEWTFVATTYPANGNPLYVTMYANEKSQTGELTSGVPLSTPVNSRMFIDWGGCGGGQYQMQVANEQIYNASLDSASINALYLEGIGGAPIDMQNLVAWWPLNGNLNDYSGNGQNAQLIIDNQPVVPNSLFWTSSWYDGYTQP